MNTLVAFFLLHFGIIYVSDKKQLKTVIDSEYSEILVINGRCLDCYIVFFLHQALTRGGLHRMYV